MSWFSVSLLFRAVHNEIISDTDLWEERVVIIDSDTEDDAKNKGLRIGKSEEHEYFVSSNDSKPEQMVRWSFVQIERIHEIEGNTLVNGREIFTRYLRNSEVQSILTPFD
jgi:hypothetical protein